jgi:hypothetical protein
LVSDIPAEDGKTANLFYSVITITKHIQQSMIIAAAKYFT